MMKLNSLIPSNPAKLSICTNEIWLHQLATVRMDESIYRRNWDTGHDAFKLIYQVLSDWDLCATCSTDKNQCHWISTCWSEHMALGILIIEQRWIHHLLLWVSKCLLMLHYSFCARNKTDSKISGAKWKWIDEIGPNSEISNISKTKIPRCNNAQLKLLPKIFFIITSKNICLIYWIIPNANYSWRIIVKSLNYVQ